MTMGYSNSSEWLEADGLGGFASGTVSGIRTRRYHALLLVATTPPAGRVVLVNGFDAWVETPNGYFPISSQAYEPDITHPDGARRRASFEAAPWPGWVFRLEDGTEIRQDIFVPKDAPMACLSWKLLTPSPDVRLHVRPFLSGRDYHSMHKANGGFRFDAEVSGERVTWSPYPGVPPMVALSNGRYAHQPDWYYNFSYTEERARGLDHTEDLASPGVLSWDLSAGEAALILTTQAHAGSSALADLAAADLLQQQRAREQKRRAAFASRLHRSADSYIVTGNRGKTIVAGYPWFTDWGRDTFIAVRGLCMATGRLDEAREILLGWADAVSEGMLPNRFPDQGDQPEYNSVDASLWYIIAIHDYLQAAEAAGCLTDADRGKLQRAMEEILDGYSKGTRFGIRMDGDGLLAAGVPGVQLTWMDAKVGDWVVTPRIGKPVEVQALWLNALWIASRFSDRWVPILNVGLQSFPMKFTHPQNGCLYDVADVNHHPGENDGSFRPNQILAVAGLPHPLIEGEQARRIVDEVEARLWTPLGLRSLAPGEPGYTPRYQGGVVQRDGSYHQGTVWPWLIGPFFEAWVRVRGGTAEARRTARQQFIQPLLNHLDEAGLEYVSEIADADAPHTPRGCPFQAWSLGELLRLEAGLPAHWMVTPPPREEIPS
jgi:predicted glycogen debranching enzyme